MKEKTNGLKACSLLINLKQVMEIQRRKKLLTSGGSDDYSRSCSD